MTTINLREFFYWYRCDEFIEVSDEVARELRADKAYEINHWRRMKRNKANYSLDAEDGIENSICGSAIKYKLYLQFFPFNRIQRTPVLLPFSCGMM